MQLPICPSFAVRHSMLRQGGGVIYITRARSTSSEIHTRRSAV